MGGGASSQSGIEDLIATTYMIGQAIAAISFPGMYRIYDFHSTKAPKLKNSQRTFSFFAPESDDDEFDDDEEFGMANPYNTRGGGDRADPSEYEHMFNVKVGDDVIYLEDPLYENQAGWTALHACCMSFLTVPAGLALIDEVVRRGGSLDIKTINGPGSFNSGWTPLQMACAYGVEPLVEKLTKEGADVNTCNSHGYSPLLDACHRGFSNIVMSLLKGGADMRYVPSDEQTQNSPFVSAPAHCALGEAARCGFYKIVELLLGAGASKDQCNSLGWTPLHEACFYNRVETVKMLLLAGANAAARTRRGALPYHLAGLQIIRDMIKDIGGVDAIPSADDHIDMLDILRELASSEASIYPDSEGNLMFIAPDETQQSSPGQNYSNFLESPAQAKVILSGESKTSSPKNGQQYSRTFEDKLTLTPAGKRGDKEVSSGPLLGELPALGRTGDSPSVSSDMHRALENPDRMMQADRKDVKRKKKKRDRDDIPKDMPKEFLCQLSHKPMSEPVKSLYGHVFDRDTILHWIETQGHICPLSGAPLSEHELRALPELGDEIRDWILQKSLTLTLKGSSAVPPTAESVAPSPSSAAAVPGKGNAGDDLYDF